MTISTPDVPRVSGSWRLAGELFEVHGELALRQVAEWQGGAKTANLDPMTRGNRWQCCNGDGLCSDTCECEDCPHPVPQDPTGEQAMAARDEFASQFHQRAERMTEDALWMRDAFHVLAPIVLPSTMDSAHHAWCTHHLKVGLCEPRKNDSERNTLCRWCSDIWSTWKELPPLAVVKDRHNGKTITEVLLKAGFKREGVILEEVNGVTKAVRKARGSTGSPNQNQRKKKAS